MMHNKFSWIQPILLVVFFATTAAADVTARGTFDAGKDVAFNAAIKAIAEKNWNLRNASYPHGAIWFVPASAIKRSDFDAAVMIQSATTGSEVSVVLRRIKKEPTQSNAQKLLEDLLRSMAGKKKAQLDEIVTQQLSISRGSEEGVLRGTDMKWAFENGLAVAKRIGRLVRYDAEAHTIVYVSHGMGEVNPLTNRISVEVTLVDQLGDVRVSTKCWTTESTKIYNGQITAAAFTEFMEALSFELSERDRQTATN